MTTYEREMLSSHSTIAKFRGWVEGNESMLRVHPPRPNKMYATFEIEKYVAYEKPGQRAAASRATKRPRRASRGSLSNGGERRKPRYGDPEQTVARFAEDDLDIAFKTKIEASARAESEVSTPRHHFDGASSTRVEGDRWHHFDGAFSESTRVEGDRERDRPDRRPRRSSRTATPCSSSGCTTT